MVKSETTKTSVNGKKFRGIVTSKSSANTVKVKVERKQQHPLYGKIIKSHKNYLAHFEGEMNEIHVGEAVTIQEVKPISKKKRFKVVK